MARAEVLKEKKVEDQPVEILTPPDGGWGWFIALGSFVITLLSPMGVVAYSMLYSHMFKENGTSSTTIATIFNLNQLGWNLTTVLVPPLCAEFGRRRVTFIGGVIVGSSFILSSFFRNAHILFFTFSLLYGIGGSLSLTVWSFIIPDYFVKNRGRVLGLAASGLCASQFIVPLLLNRLQHTYGNWWAIALTGALFLNICVAASLFQPVEWHYKRTKAVQMVDIEDQHSPLSECTSENEDIKGTRNSMGKECSFYESMVSLSTIRSMESQDHGINKDVYLSSEHSGGIGKLKSEKFAKINSIMKQIIKNVLLLKYIRVIILSVSISISLTNNANFLMVIPFVIASKGHSMEFTAYCLTVCGVCNTIARAVAGSLTDILKIKSKWYYMMGSFIFSVSLFIMAIVTEEKWLLVACGLEGVGIGCCITMITFVIIEVMGLDFLPPITSATAIVSTLMSFTLGPLVGVIRDATQNYNNCLLFLSAGHMVPLVLWLAMPLAIKWDKKREDDNCQWDTSQKR